MLYVLIVCVSLSLSSRTGHPLPNHPPQKHNLNTEGENEGEWLREERKTDTKTKKCKQEHYKQNHPQCDDGAAQKRREEEKKMAINL